MANAIGEMPFAFSEGLEELVMQSESLTAAAGAIAEDVRATFAVGTLAGEPIQEQRGTLTAENYENYRPRPDLLERALVRIEELGLRTVKVGRFGVTVSGPAALIEEIIGTRLALQARRRQPDIGATLNFARSFSPPAAADLFVSPLSSLTIPAQFSEAVDHVVFTPPPLYLAPPSANAPAHAFHGVDEAAIRRILNVPAGYDGQGITVAVVDSGFYPHPYYSSRGLDYRGVPTQSAPRPDVDAYGHGTAICLNVFAVAPGVRLLGFAQTNPPQDALEDAADAGADIISCSWGWDSEQVFPIVQATLLDIIRDGKLVLFAAGNGHYAWPGSQPELMSIGGVYSDAAAALEASNYASGYMSSLFPGRRIPDFCGLCGQRPKAIYIMMPTQPDNTMDRRNAGPDFPDQDESAPDDGWVGASGTSSATPQIAGVAALMLQKARAGGVALGPGRAKQIMEQTSRAITAGRNAMGFPAAGHPSTATGWGLVDATAAVAAV